MTTSTYNSLPFEIHDTIMSKLCECGTFKDVIAYGMTSKYHYEVLKQNTNVERIKAYSKCIRVKPKKNNCQMTAIIRTCFPIDFLNGLWMENNSGQLVQAQFFGNQYCIEQLFHPKIDGGGWIPFGFSRYHGFYGFPVGSLAYVQLSVVLTFDRPQTDEFKLYAYGQRLQSYESRYNLFATFEISYPIVVDLFSQLNFESNVIPLAKRKEEKRFIFHGGCFSCVPVVSRQNAEEEQDEDDRVYNTKKGVYIKRPNTGMWTRILKLFSR
jgi:hypothetical protein